MVEILSSKLLSIGAVLLANGRIGYVRTGTSARPSHPQMVVKWMAGDDGGEGGLGSGGTRGNWRWGCSR
jgi:hypothetical protein